MTSERSAAPPALGEAEAVRLAECRRLFLLCTALVPLFWFGFRLTNPQAVDPLWARAGIAFLFWLLYAGTFVVPWMRRHCVLLVRAGACLVLGWFLWLTAANDFSPDYAVGLLFCVFVLSVGFRVGLSSLPVLVLYLAGSAGTVAAVLAAEEAPSVSPWIFMGFVLSTGLVIYVECRSRLQMQAALEASEQSFRAAIEGSMDAFFILHGVRDATGALADLCFAEVNRRGEELLGADRARLTGMCLKEVFPVRADDTFLDRCERVIRTGEPFEEVMFVDVPGLENRWLALQVVRLGDGVAIFVRDVTSAKAFEAELIAARNRAEESSRLKTNIIANMSHEVRTPLTAILGFAQLLQEEVREEHREFVDLIIQGANRLLGTLTSVLDLARLRSEDFALRPVPFDAAEHVAAVGALYAPLAGEKGVRLEVRVPPEGLPVVLDETALHRVLTSLVSNAVKFTARGSVLVEAAADAAHLTIRVQDTGVGIGPEFMQHLFDEFTQESDGIARAYEGTGLGLAITRRLLDHLGGRISVQSEKGLGTTCVVTLPRMLAPAPGARPEGRPPLPPPSHEAAARRVIAEEAVRTA